MRGSVDAMAGPDTRGMSVFISLEDLRVELKHFFLEGFKLELKDSFKEMADHVRKDVQGELEVFMEKLPESLGQFERPSSRSAQASPRKRTSVRSGKGEDSLLRSTDSALLRSSASASASESQMISNKQPSVKDLMSSISFKRKGNQKSKRIALIPGRASGESGNDQHPDPSPRPSDKDGDDASSGSDAGLPNHLQTFKYDVGAKPNQISPDADSVELPGAMLDADDDERKPSRVSAKSRDSGESGVTSEDVGRKSVQFEADRKRSVRSSKASQPFSKQESIRSNDGMGTLALASHFLQRRMSRRTRQSSISGPSGASQIGHKARSLVKSAGFDYVFGSLLLINGLFIGFETNYYVDNDVASQPIYFKLLNPLFCVAFSVELGIRLAAHGWSLYTMTGWQWAYFDSLIVGIQIVDEMTILFLQGTNLQKAIQEVGVIRMFRLARIVRLVRMVRLIPELKSMVYLISASMWSFIWAMVLIVMLMYCMAVFYTDIASKISEESTPEQAKLIRRYYGTLPVSILSLFQAITGGDDWRNFIDVFSHDSQYVMCAFMFSVYVSFAMLVMLNLVTGVFVEGAQRIVKQDKDAELMRTVYNAFGRLDEDNTMCVSREDFMSHLDEGDLDEYFKVLDLSKMQAEILFMLLDEDCSGSLNVNEFVRGCIGLRGPARSIDLAALAHDFQVVTEKIMSDQMKQYDKIKGLVKFLSQSMATGGPSPSMSVGPVPSFM